MIDELTYSIRANDDEFFITAPCDDLHKYAIGSISEEAIYDSVLEEWRVPKIEENPDEIINRLKNVVREQLKNPVASLLDTKDGLLFGYAEATQGEGAEDQIDALRAAGIPDNRIFFDKLFGRYPDRPKLLECIELLGEGDALIVCNLNRLARSLTQLVDTSEAIKGKNAYLRSLSEEIDTRDLEYAHFISHLKYAAEFEKRANSERTKAGLKQAKIQGRRAGGRRRSLTNEKIEMVIKLILDGMPMDKVAEYAEVSRATIYRNIGCKPDELREIFDKEGFLGIDNLIKDVTARYDLGLTEEKKAEILRLYKADNSIQWITDQMQFNRETVRRVIEEAHK